MATTGKSANLSVDVTEVGMDVGKGQLSFQLVFTRKHPIPAPESVAPLSTDDQDPALMESFGSGPPIAGSSVKISQPPAGEVTFTLVRSYKQLQWLHSKLAISHPTMFLPPFPDRPTTADHDYVEKKRLQMQRYLSKVFARREYESDRDAQYFLSRDMVTGLEPDPVPTSPMSSQGSLAKSLLPIFGLGRGDTQRGFVLLQIFDNVEGVDDLSEFEMRKSYILALEDYFSNALERFSRFVKRKEASSKDLLRIGHAFKDNFGHTDAEVPVYRNPPPHSSLSLDPEGIKRNAMMMNELYDFCSNGRQMKQHAIKEEIWHFGDILLEYKNSTAGLKFIMNERTSLLDRYLGAIRARSKHYEKLQRLKINSPSSGYEIADAETDVSRAEEDIAKTRKDYMDAKIILTREMVRFERDRVHDLNVALREYSNIQIKYERQFLNAATSLLEEW